MTPILSDFRSLGTGLRERVSDLAARVRRTAPGPAAVRAVAALAAFAGLALAAPIELLFPGGSAGPTLRLLVAIVPVSLAVGLFPRTRLVGLVLVLTVGVWLLATVGYGDAAGALRVGALAGALYLTHSAAAMAAVLPYDCSVPPRILGRWAIRVAVTLAICVPVGVVGTLIATGLPTVRSVVGPIVGSAVAAALVGLLAWLLRRR